MALTMRPNGDLTTVFILQAEEEARQRAAAIAELERRRLMEMSLLRDVAEAAEQVLGDWVNVKTRDRLRAALNALKEQS